MADTARRRIPEATVARLPLYYRALLEASEQEIGTISSERLAELAGVNAAKVRKDLSYLGSYGTRGVGYDVVTTTTFIRTQFYSCFAKTMGTARASATNA